MFICQASLQTVRNSMRALVAGAEVLTLPIEIYKKITVLKISIPAPVLTN
jgi:hypothetical protein